MLLNFEKNTVNHSADEQKRRAAYSSLSFLGLCHFRADVQEMQYKFVRIIADQHREQLKKISYWSPI